jgi:hypothetical protein
MSSTRIPYQGSVTNANQQIALFQEKELLKDTLTLKQKIACEINLEKAEYV